MVDASNPQALRPDHRLDRRRNGLGPRTLLVILAAVSVVTTMVSPAASGLSPLLRSKPTSAADAVSSAPRQAPIPGQDATTPEPPVDFEPAANDGDLLVAGFAGIDLVRRYRSVDGTPTGQLVVGDGELGSARALAIGPDGLVYVAGGDTVVRFDPDTNSPISEPDGEGFVPAGAGGLANPRGLAFTPAGTLLVTSAGTGQVLEYDTDTGDLLGVVVEDGLVNPGGLAVTGDGTILVADQNNDAVVVYNADGTRRQSIDTGAGSGPIDLVLADDTVYIALHDAGRVAAIELSQLAPDLRAAAAANQVDVHVLDGVEFDAPSAVALGPDGMVWVADHWTDEIRRVDPADGSDLGPIISGEAPFGPTDLVFLVGSATTATGVDPAKPALPMTFEENRGQTGDVVDYLARGGGYQVFLSSGDAVIALGDGNSGFAVRMDLVGGAASPEVVAHGLQAGRTNYFIGDDPTAWQTNIPSFAAVEYRDVYPGIDLRYYGNDRQLEYDFVVQPGSDPSTIALQFDGATSLAIDDQGDLKIGLNPGRSVTFSAPVSFQTIDGERRTVESTYDLAGDTVRFTLGDYDPSLPLVIDPALEYSSFLGGSDVDQIYGVAADDTGASYVVGAAKIFYPTTAGVYQTNNVAGFDVVVTKVSPDGQSLVYSTFVGGGSDEYGYAIAVDGSGNAYITGETRSDDYPTPGSPLDGTRNGLDAFITKLSADGSALSYSTFLGGANGDRGDGIDVDASGNAYVVGNTLSGDFPTQSAYDGALNGSSDGFLTKVNTTGTGLVYSTYLGGAGLDEAKAIVVDGSDQAWTTGWTTSIDFPTTANTYRPSRADTSSDVFISAFDAAGSAPVYGTYLGGTSLDEGYGIDLDSSGNVYVTGFAQSTFPATAGAWDTTFSSGDEIFVAKFDPSLTGSAELIYSGFIGDGGTDRGTDVAVDAYGQAHVVGYVASSGLATGDGYDTTLDGTDGYLGIISSDGSSLLYGSYLGGTSDDYGYGVTLEASTIHVTGYTTSNDFPLVNEYDSTISSDEGWLMRFAAQAAPPDPTVATVNSTGDASDNNPGDDLCDTGGTNSEGDPECTLRAAIEEANASVTVDTIHFDIPTSDPGYSASPLVYAFTPAAQYDFLLEPVTIDASTQSGWTGDPIIELDGSSATGATAGLAIRTNDSTIRGFIVHSFPDEGLEIDGSTGFGDNNTLTNNWVGFDAAGLVVGNTDDGILVSVDATGNLVGGTGANDGNRVAGGGGAGINVRTNSFDNTLLGNEVWANTGLGIDLDDDGVTTNDAGDGDSGSNDLLNYPVITSAAESSGTVAVDFDLDVPDGNYRVEFFTNSSGADPSGNGEGESFVGSVDVTVTSGVPTPASTTFAGTAGDITATATEDLGGGSYGSTSEFSAAVTASGHSGPMAIWRRNGSSTPYYSAWDGSTFGGTQTSAAVGDFRLMQGAESPTRDEAIVIGVDSGGSISGERWDGSSWTALPALGSTSQNYWWSVDVAYEPVSGDAVVVYTDGSSLNYRVWNGATWSTEASVPEPPGGTPRQMHLAAHPFSDEMVLVVSNDSSQDYAVVWDGSAWGNALTLDSTGSGNDRTDVYVAYEQQSGRALVVWGSGNDDVQFRVWDSGWSSEFVTPGIGGGYARWVTLGADPNSDNIAMGVLTNDADVWLAVWTGSGWVNQTTATTTTTGPTEPAVAVAFEGTSGQAIATYGESASTPRYRTWDSGVGWSAEGNAPDIGSTPNSMMLFGEPGADGAMLAAQDDSSDLHYVYWNGTAWGTDNELETSSGETKNQPFLFLWNATSVSSLLVVNSGGNSADANPGNGGCDTGGTNSEGATECTLLAAIQEANAYAGPNDIHFAIPDSDPLYRNLGAGLSYWRIQPTTPLTPLTDGATMIDATTQTTHAVSQGYFVNGSGPEVEINNTGGAGGNGLEIQSDGNEIRGLVVNRFPTGINVKGGNNNLIAGNYVGTDPSGTIDTGNTTDGITIRDGATGNTVGGSTVADRNIIAGNDNDGIWITGTGTDDNVVQGNWIGFGADGSNLGNSYHGVAVEFGAANNLVGGTTAGEANRIGNSAWDGIAFNGGNGTGNAALRNSIVDNTGLGIDIDNNGVTANDAGDGDTGDNDLLNYPVITSATEAGGTVTVTFDLDVPAGTYRVEFFDNTAADGSGYGEGETFLSAATVSAGTGLTHNFPGAEGDILTATTTEDLGGGSYGSTSEFSGAFTVTPANQPPVFDQDLGDRSDAETSVISLSASATDPDGDTLVYSATGLPLGLSIDSDSGLISGMINHAAAASSPYSVEISVTDGVNPAVNDTFAWTVTDVPTSDPYLVAGTGGTGGGDDLLTTVDPASSDPVSNEVDIGTGTGTSGIEAAAIEPLSGVLYAVDGGQLGTLDVDSGVFTAFGPGLGTGDGEYGAVTFDDVRGMAFHPLTGVIWAVHSRPGQIDVLFRIDPATGAHIPDAFGAGIDYIKLRQHGGATDYIGLAINPTDWQLYGVISDGAGTDYLVAIRTGNGNAKVVGSLAQPLTDISFDSTGQLWGIDAGALYQVTATSGILDAGRTIDNGAAYGALAFAVPSASPPSLEGTVFEDIDGDALAAGQFPTDATNPGVPGVTVRLYRDDGTVPGEPDTADTLFASKVTGPTGKYFFQGVPEATYYVVIDSTTVSPSAGGSGWAEQSYGPVGAATFDGSYSFAVAAGPLFGGKQGAVSDDQTNAATAEHVARLALTAGAEIEDVDFGFSFNVITNLEGADATSAQGSLRRFIDNANAATGPNTMRFVPMVAANGSDGGGNTWWSLAPTATLPVVTDADAVLDATAYDAADGITTVDSNALGPELELDGSGVSGTGLELAGSNGEVRGFVINRFATGIALTGGSANTIAGNYIGTSADGVTGGVGNIVQGVLVDQSPGNVIGGISATDRNIISGNRQRGIAIDDWSDGAAVTSGGTQIINNHIGVDRTGIGPVPYDGTPQYQQIGVYVLDSSSTVIGAPSTGNVISGNPWYGIYGFGSNGTGNVIQNNIVGLDAAESGSVPNGTESSTRGGIFLSSTVGTLIGGAGVGEGNTIATNGFFGVVVSGAAADNSILGNTITGNGDLGIGLDLDGVTVNDAGDVDSGPNDLLNHPVPAAPVSGDTTLDFELDVPAGDYRIEVFTNPTEGADPSGYGEGETLLAAQTVTHTGSGPEPFVLAVPSVLTGDVLTATATEDLGGGSYGATSEYSAAVTVVTDTVWVFDASVRRSDVFAEGGLDPVSAATTGAAGSALSFNGGGELLRGPGLNITDTELTVSAWIRPGALGGTDYVVSKQISGGDPIYELGVDGTGQAVATLTIGGGPVVVQGGTVTAGTWHHAAVTWDGSTVRLYVDGSEVNSAPASGSLSIDIATDVVVGNRSSGSNGFDGEIDHVEIGHVALTANEIAVRHSTVADQALTISVGQQQTDAAGSWIVSGLQSRSGGFALAAPETADSGAAAWAVATGIDEPGVVFETWWWASIATGVDLASGTRAGQSPTDQFDAAFVGADTWDLRRRSGAADAVDGSGTQALTTGTWVKVEQWTDQNGASRLLVDGVEVAPWTAQAALPAGGSLGLRVGRLPGGQSWYVDDPRARRLVMPEPTSTLGPLDRD